MHAPTTHHIDVAYQILKYLKGSPGHGLVFTKHHGLQVEDYTVEAYTNVDYVGSITNRRSTSGY